MSPDSLPARILFFTDATLVLFDGQKMDPLLADFGITWREATYVRTDSNRTTALKRVLPGACGLDVACRGKWDQHPC